MAMRGNAAVARRYDRASRRHVLGVVPFGRFPPGRPPSVQRPLLALETSGAVNIVGAMYNLEGEVADPTDAVRWILAQSQVFMDTMVAVVLRRGSDGCRSTVSPWRTGETAPTQD